MKIYLDMDNCITNFDKRVLEILGKPMSAFPKAKVAWEAMGDKLDTLFLDLEPMPDAQLLVDEVFSIAKYYQYSVGVLTAIPKVIEVPLAAEHKKQWLSKHFPQLLEDFNIGPYAIDKQNHCVPGDILIDDSILNIPQWTAKGGYGILHTSANRSIQLLRGLLFAMNESRG